MLGILKNVKAQNTAEYAIIIGLVVAVAIGMQTYVKRGLQAKMKDAATEHTQSIANAPEWQEINPAPVEMADQFEPKELSAQSTSNDLGSTALTTLSTGGKARKESTQSTQQASGDYQKYKGITDNSIIPPQPGARP